MGPIKEILAETQFQEELTSSSQTKLVVVDFTASWCGPCQTIAPFYEQLSRKYPNAVFLKVDVDKCQETAVNQRVSVMPTFHFYRNKVKVDSMQGADRQKLEEIIQKYYDDGTAEDVGVSGHPSGSQRKKSSGKQKDKEKTDGNQDPDLEAARMGSTHHMGNENRSSFKEGAKKIFGHRGKTPEEKTPSESGGKKKTSVSQSQDDGASKNRRSFKDIVDNIFHPHQNKNDPQNPDEKNEKKTPKEARSSQIAKEQKKKKKKEDK